MRLTFLRKTRWLLITLGAILAMMATMSVGAAASDKVLVLDQDNEVLINLGDDADSVMFTGEGEASDELVINDVDGVLTLTADYKDGVARVGIHSENGADLYTLMGTGPVVGIIDDDGGDVDTYDIDFCGTDGTGPPGEGLTIDDDGGANIVNINLNAKCEDED